MKRYICIEKIGIVTSGLPAASIEEHVAGTLNEDGHSLPIEYSIEGYIYGDITVGETVTIDRKVRNGIKVDGFFETTVVTEVGKGYFKTKNSVYTYKFVVDN